jgi:hypothetical protein
MKAVNEKKSHYYINEVTAKVFCNARSRASRLTANLKKKRALTGMSIENPNFSEFAVSVGYVHDV